MFWSLACLKASVEISLTSLLSSNDVACCWTEDALIRASASVPLEILAAFVVSVVAEANGHRQAEETAKQAKETAQASGNQKLLDLGLTQAEATALTGYTPPVEE